MVGIWLWGGGCKEINGIIMKYSLVWRTVNQILSIGGGAEQAMGFTSYEMNDDDHQQIANNSRIDRSEYTLKKQCGGLINGVQQERIHNKRILWSFSFMRCPSAANAAVHYNPHMVPIYAYRRRRVVQPPFTDHDHGRQYHWTVSLDWFPKIIIIIKDNDRVLPHMMMIIAALWGLYGIISIHGMRWKVN